MVIFFNKAWLQINIYLESFNHKWTPETHSHLHLAFCICVYTDHGFHTSFSVEEKCCAHLLSQSYAAFVFKQKCSENLSHVSVHERETRQGMKLQKATAFISDFKASPLSMNLVVEDSTIDSVD